MIRNAQLVYMYRYTIPHVNRHLPSYMRTGAIIGYFCV